MRVRAARKMRAGGAHRAVGDEFDMPPEDAIPLIHEGALEAVGGEAAGESRPGKSLDTETAPALVSREPIRTSKRAKAR